MPRRRSGVTVSLLRVGDGKVSLDPPPELLLPPESQIVGPPAHEARNLRLDDGVAEVRPGYTELGTAPNTNRVTGMFYAVWDDGTEALLRFTKTTAHSYTTSGGYTDVTGTLSLGGLDDDDYWESAMVPRVGTDQTKVQVMAVNGVTKPGVMLDASDTFNHIADADCPTGAKHVLSFGDRAILLNVNDSGGFRKHSRVEWSAIGDASAWDGSFLDLSADPHPISAARVMANGIAVLKGDENGGAIWRVDLTGLALAPFRTTPINPGSGVGILLPRSFVLVGESLGFFVGHDALYVYDGIRGLQPVSPEITKSILKRINHDKLEVAFAWYKKQTAEIHIAIPTGSNDYPDEVWVYNLRERRSYGPYQYTQPLTAVSNFVASETVTWGDLDGVITAPITRRNYQWRNLPWRRWGDIGGTKAAPSIGFGDNNGSLYNDQDDVAAGDAGIVVTGAYTTPDIGAQGRLRELRPGIYERLSADDELTLRDITIRYRDISEWTPAVEVSNDGGASWTLISDNTAIGTGSGRILKKTYSHEGLTGLLHRVRVSGTNMQLVDVVAEFTHGGDSKAG